MRATPLFVLMLAGCTASDDFAFRDVSVTLPDDTSALPPGPNVDLVTANCTGCHSPAMILTQPRIAKAGWEGEVTKMVKVYKAPVDPSAVPAIVDYLVATNARLAK